jgi:hypothetical protein
MKNSKSSKLEEIKGGGVLELIREIDDCAAEKALAWCSYYNWGEAEKSTKI